MVNQLLNKGVVMVQDTGKASTETVTSNVGYEKDKYGEDKKVATLKHESIAGELRELDIAVDDLLGFIAKIKGSPTNEVRKENDQSMSCFIEVLNSSSERIYSSRTRILKAVEDLNQILFNQDR